MENLKFVLNVIVPEVFIIRLLTRVPDVALKVPVPFIINADGNAKESVVNVKVAAAIFNDPPK